MVKLVSVDCAFAMSGDSFATADSCVVNGMCCCGSRRLLRSGQLEVVKQRQHYSLLWVMVGSVGS